MAKAKIKEDSLYQVELNRSIMVGRRPVHPGPNVKLLGNVLQAAIDADAEAVKSYEPAKPVGE